MHTKEPWIINGYGAVMANADRLLVTGMALNTGMHSNLAEENTRRIVACVNACAGIETSLLESEAITGDNHPWQLMNKALKKAESERDELLAALKIIANPDSNHPAFVRFDHIDTAYEQIAREAIEKAEGLQE